MLMKRTLNQSESIDAQTAASTTTISSLNKTLRRSANLSSQGLGLTPRSVLKRPALSRQQPEPNMPNVLGCLSASDLNAMFNKKVGLIEQQKDAIDCTQTTPSALDLETPAYTHSCTYSATPNSELVTKAKLTKFYPPMTISPKMVDTAGHNIPPTTSLTASTAAGELDCTSLGAKVIYRAQNIGFFDAPKQRPTEELNLHSLLKDILNSGEQCPADQHYTQSGVYEAMPSVSPISYAILPIFNESSDTLQWWSIALGTAQSCPGKSQLQASHGEMGDHAFEAISQAKHRSKLDGIVEKIEVEANSVSTAWWELPPGLSVLARNVARQRKDSLTSSDSLPATRQQRFDNSSSSSATPLSDHQVNLLSTFKSLGSSSGTASSDSRPYTIDSGVDMSCEAAVAPGGLSFSELESKRKYLPPQNRADQGSDVNMLGSHHRVMSQASEAGGVSL